MSYSMSMPTKKAKQHKHRQKKLEHSLIQKKSLEPRFGPKHKGRLCDTLTSSVILFDVDESGGLDWSEFQVFNTAIVDVVKDHTALGEFDILKAFHMTNRSIVMLTDAPIDTILTCCRKKTS